MKCLVVIAHPLGDSLCASMAKKAVATLTANGHEVVVENLYAEGFGAALSVAERVSYYAGRYDSAATQPAIDRLLWAEGLVLCFPTWWFGFPAILKGWFDRTWAPGFAYDHASDLGPIKPRLKNLRRMLAVTTLGAPWWVDRIVMRQPVRRVLKTAILGACAPSCRFEMLTQYKSENLNGTQVERFASKVEHTLARWRD